MLAACGSPAVPGATPAGTPGATPAATPGAAPRAAPGPQFWHETSWDAVRARALGHLAAQGRDLARARALAGDHAGCAERYAAAAAEVVGTPISEPDPRRIRDAFAAALTRDAQLCAALAEGRHPPAPPTPVAALYARAAAARRTGLAFSTGAPPPILDLPRAAGDPAARTALRATLTEAWADTADPLAPTDPWDYWEPAEALRVHARAAGPRASEPFVVSAADLATPPTGDTYVDSAGLPGPRAVVPAGVTTTPSPPLNALARALAMAGPTRAIPALNQVRRSIADGPDSDRVQRGAEGAVLRGLARAGFYSVAAAVAHRWRVETPFDRDCIDRAGVVLGIEGRLLLLADDPSAESVLEDAQAASRAFLAGLPAGAER
ncbi:MAG: hypothetical protein Q8P18_29410 [Pseudomonadota bacterium]|nr:hypothetical protein [Pseudomonadota bacterium]